LDRNLNHPKDGFFFTYCPLCKAEKALGSKFTFVIFYEQKIGLSLPLILFMGSQVTLWASILDFRGIL